MNASEIKIDLFRKLDSLKGKRLEEAYGMLLNFINSKNEIDEWQDLSKEQQEEILLGVEQLDKGQGRSHKDLIRSANQKFRPKFIN